MVTLIIEEPPEDAEDSIRFKYPSIACELLSCDVPSINDKLVESEELLNNLYGYLKNEPPLNPLLASFFSKTFGNITSRKTEQVSKVVRHLPNT